MASAVRRDAAYFAALAKRPKRYWNSLPERAGSLTNGQRATARPAPAAPSSQGEEDPRLFQVTLLKGLKGLPATTRAHVQALGLSKRFQVVWRRPSPEAVGNLLRVKELVHVDLVPGPCPPPKPVLVPGYRVLGNALGGGSPLLSDAATSLWDGPLPSLPTERLLHLDVTRDARRLPLPQQQVQQGGTGGMGGPTLLHVLGPGAVGLWHGARLATRYQVRFLPRPGSACRVAAGSGQAVPPRTRPPAPTPRLPVQEWLVHVVEGEEGQAPTTTTTTTHRLGVVERGAPDSERLRVEGLHTLLVTTKAQDVVPALLPLVPSLRAAATAALAGPKAGEPPTICLLLNGVLRVEQEVRALLHAHRIPAHLLLASTTHGLLRTGTHTVRHTGHGRTVVGLPSPGADCFSPPLPAEWDAPPPLGGTSRHRDVFLAALAAGAGGSDMCVLSPDVLHRALLLKLMVSSVLNPIATLHDQPNGVLLHHPTARAQVRAACDEIRACFAADLPPDVLARMEPTILQVARDTAANCNSMLVDVRRGARRLEWDYLSGHLVQLARARGRRLPLQEAMKEELDRRLQLRQRTGHAPPDP